MLMKVSVIIPCRNERNYIGNLLENIVAQTHPKEDMEVFVVDGMSDDGTREIVEKYERRYGYITLVDNEERVVPHALNRGIRLAKGENIIIMGAHSVYPNDYISRLLHWQQKLNADNVGGIAEAMPVSQTPAARAVAIVLAHPFGVGNAWFRIGAKEPREVDTVPFGCYKREVFDNIGLFDEDLIRNQDDEFNMRLKRKGGKIFIVPEIRIVYYPREKIGQLWRMYHQYGLFKPLIMVKTGAPSNLRQFAPPLFVLFPAVLAALGAAWLPLFYAACAVVGMYCIVNLYFSFRLALRNGIRLFFPLCCCFATVHYGYGTGYLRGIVRFNPFRRKRNTDPGMVRLSR